MQGKIKSPVQCRWCVCGKREKILNKIMQYIKIIKLGFAGWFNKRFFGEQKMGWVKKHVTRVSGPY